MAEGQLRRALRDPGLGTELSEGRGLCRAQLGAREGQAASALQPLYLGLSQGAFARACRLSEQKIEFLHCSLCSEHQTSPICRITQLIVQ